MKEYLPDLRLDVETILLDREFCHGLAVAYRTSAAHAENDEQRYTHLAFSATNFRRAGAHAILLDEFSTARELLVEAAKVYAQLEMPYALKMFALAGNLGRAQETFNRILEAISARGEPSRSLRRQLVYLLVFAAVNIRGPNVETALERVRREVGASGSYPIGVLGLPVASYLSLASALAGSEYSAVEEALLPFLTAYNTAIRQASYNSYHWSRMRLPFHPAEPDTLSVLVLADLAMRRIERSVFDVLERIPLSRASGIILQGALRQRL
jgi:hypothetical protein